MLFCSATQSAHGDALIQLYWGRLRCQTVALPPKRAILRQMPPPADASCEAAGIMHSNVRLTAPALAELRKFWSGPLLAYPDSGYFTMPDWQFVDIIAPQELAEFAASWVENNRVQIVGGCCGLGVEHIRRLRDTLR